MKKFIYFLFTVALLGSIVSCTEDSLEPTLEQEKALETSIKTVEDLSGLLYGMFNRMTATAYYGRDVIIYGDIRSDNCWNNANSGRFSTPSTMDMGEEDAYARDTWSAMYRVIASANIVIGQEDAEIEGDAAEINQIIGQAYAIRALAHFDALKLYGQQNVTGGTMGVPYVLTYKGTEESLTPARNTVDEVKANIYADLTTALSLMTASLDDNTSHFISTNGVQAIKSRVATYFGDWPDVITASEAVINSAVYSVVPAADFVASWSADGSVNSVFALAFSSVDNMNINGLSQIYRGSAYGDIRVLDDLLAVFDAGDVRASAGMIDYDPNAPTYLTNLGKYPSLDYSDDVNIIRYEEVILNYAEALFETGGTGLFGSALAALNEVPSYRGGALPYAAINKDNILLERRKEFCFEGLRFDDLARTGRNIPVVDVAKQTHGGPAYGDYNFAFPIPKNELNANKNMVQNSGY